MDFGEEMTNAINRAFIREELERILGVRIVELTEDEIDDLIDEYERTGEFYGV